MSGSDLTRAQLEFAALVAQFVSPMALDSAVDALLILIRRLPHLPLDAWTGAAAEYVGRNANGVPNLARLEKLIAGHLAQIGKSAAPGGVDWTHPPEVQASGLPRSGQVWAAGWWTHAERRDLPDGELVFRLDLMRRHDPQAYGWLTNRNDEAASIAVSKGWDRGPGDWTEGRIATSVAGIMLPARRPVEEPSVAAGRALLLRMLRAAVKAQTPDLEHLVPTMADLAERSRPPAPVEPMPPPLTIEHEPPPARFAWED